MAEPLSPTLRAVSDAVLAVAAELSVEEVLQRLVDGARELAGARYAALGIPDGEGGFRSFLTSGMSEELIASLGPLPAPHGVLGAMLEATELVPHARHPRRTRASAAGGRTGIPTCARSSASRSSRRRA